MSRAAALALLMFAVPASAAVPISIAPTGHATVPVTGEFGTQQFVFDTGAEGSAVYADFADAAGLQRAGTEKLQAQTGTSEVPLVRLGRLTLDGSTSGSLEAVRLDPRADGVPLAGIVGLDVFGDRVVDFDLPRRQLSLLTPGSRPVETNRPPVNATPTAGNLLTIPVRVGAATAVAVLDTGARKTRINWKLGRLLGLDPEKAQVGDVIQGATNAAIQTASATVRDVHLGSRVLDRAPVLVADLPVFTVFGVADKPAIILGLDWLESTRMVIDFPAWLVWFEPAAR